MGRPGAGGGGGRPSGGGHSVSRGGSGHRVNSSNSRPGASNGSSRRPSGGSNFGSSGWTQLMGGWASPSRHCYGNHYGHRTTYNNTTIVNTTFGGYVLAKALSAMVALAVVLIIFVVTMANNRSNQVSTIQRTKVESGNAYINDNIVDEIGRLSNPSRLSTKLKSFYNKTGVTPYIYLRAYDSSLTSDSAKEAWARQYYENTFDREDVLLYVYFEEANPDVEGYMYLVYGLQTGQIMDSEAEEIFWNYLDSAWSTYTSDQTDEMFQSIFDNTATTIMKVSTTGKDIVKWVIIAGVVLILVVGGIVFFTRWASYKILRTPIKDLAEDVHNDTADLEDKYLR